MNPGNLVFIVSEMKHPRFRREGDNLHTFMVITLKEALLGFEKDIEHLDGSKINIKRTDVTQPGLIIKKKHEGMPVHQHGGENGDLFIRIDVKFPDDLTEEQRQSNFIVLM